MSKPATAVSDRGVARVMAGVRMPQALLDRIDAYCARQPLQPSRTKVIELAIREFLEREEALERERKRA
jgi:metal-responsive CopG/Arc/MetJ family transcriptional regulator